jgi:ABC-type transporter Mla subunit MlaD
MKDNKINATIAITTVVAAILMAAALSFAIGKWSFGNTGYEVTIKFPNASGITPNSEVKYAGARAGKVKEVKLIARSDQDEDPHTRMYNCVDVVVMIDRDVVIGKDLSATIKQDGFGISPKYVQLAPGFDLSDLIQPAGEALSQAKVMLGQLGPIMNRLDRLSDTLDHSLPPLIGHADKFLQDGDGVLANFNTPAGKERLNEMLDSLRVTSENLKVVSTNAKALTATLAEKPWRVFWGGPTVLPPTEDQILDSNKVLRLKPDVDVSGTPSTNKTPANK